MQNVLDFKKGTLLQFNLVAYFFFSPLFYQCFNIDPLTRYCGCQYPLPISPSMVCSSYDKKNKREWVRFNFVGCFGKFALKYFMHISFVKKHILIITHGI